MHKKWWVLMAVFLLAGACGRQEETIAVEVTRVERVTAVPTTIVTPAVQDLMLRPTTVTVVVTETPAPPPTPALKELVICQAQAPGSLYLYDSSMLAADSVRHAVYENLYTNIGYAYQPQGLEKLPSLADGDARLQSVEVAAGDWVVDSDGAVVQLAEGVVVRADDGEQVRFDGSLLTMPQLTVDFVLKPMVWSDGTAVTADDSIFSFELNEASLSFWNAELVARTAVYEVTGDLSLRWVGLPGYLDQTYFLNVWPPLPRHQLGQYAPDEIASVPEAVQMPLSSGPFIVSNWDEGNEITLVKNPYYYRADEGLPYLDQVTFRFIPDSDQVLTDLLAGTCDIGTQDALNMGQIPFMREAEAADLLTPHVVPGVVWEHIDFGIDSAGEYGDGNGRFDWFEDVRVRQAMMMCTNRQQMVDEVMFGASDIINAYLPDSHPLLPDDLPRWPYDVAAANALLDEAGFVDRDGDGVREAADGTRFEITLISTTGGELRPAVSSVFVQNMRDCGIVVNEAWLPSGEMFAGGPEGPLFGRQFDLALFAWLTGTTPDCTFWQSEQIPGVKADGFRGWGGLNGTGWHSLAFDAACDAVQAALPGTPAYEIAHQEALWLFAEGLPVMPLFLRLKTSAARPEVRNFRPDSTQPSELWNLYELDVE
ncbi:MAG: hypothetical protein KC419_21080 [Anaerolineales bacterium]|nr:hypothetical protein [Anaerolineales bacterium]